MARPSWDPAEQKELNQLRHSENTEVEGSVGSEAEDRCDLHLEEKARGISGNLMGK